jgi:hypothetical protein
MHGPRTGSGRLQTASEGVEPKLKHGDQLTSWTFGGGGAAFRNRIGAVGESGPGTPSVDRRVMTRIGGPRSPRQPPTPRPESWHQYVWGRRSAAPIEKLGPWAENYLLRSGTFWWCRFPLRCPAASFWNRAFRGTDTSPYPSQPPSLTAATAFQSGGVRRGGRGEHIAYFTGDWCLYCLL